MTVLDDTLKELTPLQIDTWNMVSYWYDSIDWTKYKDKREVQKMIETGFRASGYTPSIAEAERLFCRKLSIVSVQSWNKERNALYLKLMITTPDYQRKILHSLRLETSLYMALLSVRSGVRKEIKKRRYEEELKQEEEFLFEESQKTLFDDNDWSKNEHLDI